MRPTASSKPQRRIPSQHRSRGLVDAILDALARVLGASPDDPRFTTNHVAEVAGVSIGSLYQYFSSKEAIVGALAQRRVRETYDELLRTIEAAQGRPLREGIERLVDRAVTLKMAHTQLDAGVIAAVLRHGLTKEAFALDREYVARFAKAIEMFDGETRDDLVPEVAARVVFHAMRSILIMGALERPELPSTLKSELVHLVYAYLKK